ncbi:MAG: SDR family NAD(P)-dependent oxidoreductase [Rhodospirillaceae bacterium]|nr:SDR family NAD(P)-dependent oxidoreductase [Rhodospirillaceae bacterium]MCY4311080.1 SDR family NAD(P)-dependent oxidoreductase [Rhodospirillaceae bacterium]
MASPLRRSKRKNPVIRTRVPQLPPMARSRIFLGLTSAAARGVFELQVCRECGAIQYPPREACHVCLSDGLDWKEQSGAGQLVAHTMLRHAMENYFRERLPWRLGIVKLDVSDDLRNPHPAPSLIVHLHGDCPEPPAPVRVFAMLDRSGQAILVALPEKDTPHMTDDLQMREMTCDPKFRKSLVTDGKSPVGQAVVKELIKAGSDLVWVGEAAPWKKIPGWDEIKALQDVTVVDLDVTNPDSVRRCAAQIGQKVDILINTAEQHRAYRIDGRHGTENARAEMEINYLGLLRLAQEFGPVMRSRAADTEINAVAWVNILSIYALSNNPNQSTFSASKAAAHSLAQGIRASMQQAGVRVINIFPGPLDVEWNQELRPPKVSPNALAREIVKALRGGAEDVYPGDIAKDWYKRWREDPKVLERELAFAD